MALMLGSAPALPVGSEESLIVAARDGDDRALEELYARYRDRISAYIHRRIPDHGRAEDVAQEVFISALRRLRATDQPIVFKPWIYEIAKNACIDEHRRTLRNREISLDAEAELAAGRRPLLSLAPTPPAVLEGKQQLEDLRGAFGGLSESHHQLLVMREFAGLSYDEIGVRMGMSRQMVESALFRARRKLGAEYDELSSGRRCQQVQAAIESGRVRASRCMGVRERRQLARHLAHCQSCRMSAHAAGADEYFVRPRALGAKIAALVPAPLWGWWRGAGSRAASRSSAGSPTVQALGAASQSGASAAFTGVAVAAATLALAAGGGTSGALAQHSRPRLPRSPVAARPSGFTDIAGSPRHGTTSVVTPAPRADTPLQNSAASRRSRPVLRTAAAPASRPSAAAPADGTRAPVALPARPAVAPSLPAAHITVTAPSAAAPQVISGTLSSAARPAPVSRVVSGIIPNPGHASSASPSSAGALPSASVPAVQAHGLGRGGLS